MLLRHFWKWSCTLFHESRYTPGQRCIKRGSKCFPSLRGSAPGSKNPSYAIVSALYRSEKNYASAADGTGATILAFKRIVPPQLLNSGTTSLLSNSLMQPAPLGFLATPCCDCPLIASSCSQWQLYTFCQRRLLIVLQWASQLRHRSPVCHNAPGSAGKRCAVWQIDRSLLK